MCEEREWGRKEERKKIRKLESQEGAVWLMNEWLVLLFFIALLSTLPNLT